LNSIITDTNTGVALYEIETLLRKFTTNTTAIRRHLDQTRDSSQLVSQFKQHP